MQIKKFLRWLPVVLSLLGALGYSGHDTEWVRAGIAILKQLDGVQTADSDGIADLFSADEETRTPRSSKTKTKTATAQTTYKGTVSKVYDGDTVHVIDSHGAKHKIRMAYIDAPEMKQAYGTRSRDNLRSAAEGRKVSVRVFETDRYQREVAQVFVGKTDLNLMQVEDGAAWHYESYAKKQQNKTSFADYADAQIQAKKERKGLWHAKNPQAPWAYRRAEKNGGSQDWFSTIGKWLGIQ